MVAFSHLAGSALIVMQFVHQEVSLLLYKYY